MSNHGIATEALSPVETGHQQRHLQLVEQVASFVVASEQLPDVAVPSEEQILFGD